MKKLDKFILNIFLGPFILVLFTLVFLISMQFFVSFFEELGGKGLGIQLFRLLYYIGVINLPKVFAFAILVSALVGFGSMGENSELIIIKSSGISLTRILLFPTLLSILCSFGILMLENYCIPYLNNKTFSLLYNLRRKKPSLAIQEGVFCNDISGYSIKINKKLSDNVSLEDIMIYDHRDPEYPGNTQIITAKRGKMYTIQNEKYLVMELYEGNQYKEEMSQKKEQAGEMNKIPDLTSIQFEKTITTIDLSEFQLKKTDEKMFSHRPATMSNTKLNAKIRSAEQSNIRSSNYTAVAFLDKFGMNIVKKNSLKPFQNKHTELVWTQQEGFKLQIVEGAPIDRILNPVEIKQQTNIELKDQYISPTNSNSCIEAPQLCFVSNKLECEDLSNKTLYKILQIKLSKKEDLKKQLGELTQQEKQSGLQAIESALNEINQDQEHLKRNLADYKEKVKEINSFVFEKYKRYSVALNCIIMFLIGASLGIVLKKSGLGIPLVICTVFFVINYIFTILGEDLTKYNSLNPIINAFLGNLFFLPITIFVVIQAYRDNNLFEIDFYRNVSSRLYKRLKKLKIT